MTNGAVVIGCSAYEDPDVSALRYAHRDAGRVAAVLSQACGVSDEMMLLFSDDATEPRLRPTFTNIVGQVSRWDRLPVIDGILFCFFSGHGFQSDSDQYFLPVDGVRGALETTSIGFSLLLKMLSVSPARHIVLFLDACRSVITGGKAAGDFIRPDVAALCPPGMVSFCSCDPGKASYEVDAIESGVFTEALCEALSDQGRCRNIYELDKFLAKRMPELAAEHSKPRQDLYSRVEPLGVQQLPVVTPLQQNIWLAATPIGSEHRVNSAPARVAWHRGRVSEPLVAFDFGTSYSVAAAVGADGRSLLVPWSGLRILMPSVVHFLPGLDYLTGSAAIEADRYAPQSTIRHVKRSLGTDTCFEIEGRSITPELAASLILRSLRASAEAALGSPVRRCIASYPANFSIPQRNALQRAYELAGLDVYRMIAEPNAAALTLKESEPGWEGICLVVDLGGGTFDVAVVDYGYGTDRLSGPVCEIVAIAGSDTVGGLDYDAILAQHVERELRERTGWTEPLDPVTKAQIYREADRAKRELGVHEECVVFLQDIEVGSYGLQDISIRLNRDNFRDISAPLNAQIREVLLQVRDDWRDSVRDSAHGDPGVVLLAGQGSKIFTVREELDRFGHEARYVAQFQETAVAYGLGWQAGVLSGAVHDMLLLDLLSVGIGVRCVEPSTYIRDGVIVSPTYRRSMYSSDSRETPVVISSNSAENKKECPLVTADSTIPTLRWEMARLSSSPDKPVCLEIVENRKGVVTKIGDIIVPGHHQDRDVDVICDIDAGNTVTVEIVDSTLRECRRFQLNNLYRLPPPYLTEQYQDLQRLLAEGYAFYPVQPVDTPVAAPSSAVREGDFVESELKILDAIIADCERTGNRDPMTASTSAMYYRSRAAVHEQRKDAIAAALDYIESFKFGRPTAAGELSRVLPLISRSNSRVNEALNARLPDLEPELSWFHRDPLKRLAAQLKKSGYPRSASRCDQLVAAAERLGTTAG